MVEKVTITRDNGEKVSAKAPVIISASRSTDIPAFYGEWFFNRLKRGYCAWKNPYNGHKMFVSFENCKFVVFWTKNPKPLIPYLHELDERGINYYFLFTLNDYVFEGFEPNLPSLDERINTFIELSEKIGKERVIWRFDPLILTDKLTPRDLLVKIWHIGNRLQGYTDKLVFSFIDLYGKTKVNMSKVLPSIPFSEIDRIKFTDEQQEEIFEGLVKMKEHWKTIGWDIEMATCAENKTYKNGVDIKHNKCIDPDLIMRLCADDTEMCEYVSGLKKASGQRPLCGCINSQDIGCYNTCLHQCAYCYANRDNDTAKQNSERHDPNNECIVE